MAKLTDKQKKKIIADYVENQNFSETARINGVEILIEGDFATQIKRISLTVDNSNNESEVCGEHDGG